MRQVKIEVHIEKPSDVIFTAMEDGSAYVTIKELTT